jgi:hypothetical protein
MCSVEGKFLETKRRRHLIVEEAIDSKLSRDGLHCKIGMCQYFTKMVFQENVNAQCKCNRTLGSQ